MVGSLEVSPVIGAQIVVDDRLAGNPPASPYSAVDLSVTGRAWSLPLGSSARPLQTVFVEESPDHGVVLVSRCPAAPPVGAPACQLQFNDLPYGPPTTLTSPSGGAADRLPATDGRRFAFLRYPAGQPTAQLLTATLAAPDRLIRLRGGRSGVGAAGSIGIAVHGKRVADVWKWRPRPGVTRTALRLQRVGDPTVTTVVSMPATSGRLVGPLWQGERLLFAVRRRSRTDLYRYMPSSRRFERATAPAQLAAFDLKADQLYSILASSSELIRGRCERSCRVTVQTVPRFAPSTRPDR